MNSIVAPFVRFTFLSIIFILNFFTLFRSLFQRKPIVCVHSITFGLCLIIINGFLSIWIPYLFSSLLYQTSWPLIELDLHCTIQQSIPLLISTIFLVIFCFEKIYETFIINRAKVICLLIFFIWILPQMIYLLFTQIVSIKDNDYYFVDNNNIINGSENQPNGILFCIDRLDSWNIRQMSWHYVTLVVPLTSVYIICTGAKRFSIKFDRKHIFLTILN